MVFLFKFFCKHNHFYWLNKYIDSSCASNISYIWLNVTLKYHIHMYYLLVTVSSTHNDIRQFTRQTFINLLSQQWWELSAISLSDGNTQPHWMSGTDKHHVNKFDYNRQCWNFTQQQMRQNHHQMYLRRSLRHWTNVPIKCRQQLRHHQIFFS